MRRIVPSAILVAMLFCCADLHADAQGTVGGLVVAVSYPLDNEGTCSIDVSSIGVPHTQLRVYLIPRWGQITCPSLFFGDFVVIHFRLESALCGPDLCAALWATARPEKN